MLQAVAQAHALEGGHGALATLAGAHPCIVHERQLHVEHSGGLGQQVVVLKHKAYLVVAQAGQLVLAHGAHGHRR